MLKWTARDGTTSGLAVRHEVGDFRGLRATDATADDIVACLRANPEAAALVVDALEEYSLLAAEMRRTEVAERDLTTVTAERDEARYWLAAHKAAAESLVDPVTGRGFFMLIGKGDDGVDGWFYTFGGPFDSYTLCERSDDEDPHFVYFQRERYDHDQGCWIDGCEVVEPVLAPDECSVAPYCLEAVTEERDALKRERDEARAEKLRWSGIADSANRELELAWLELGPDDDHATVAGGIRDLRARLAKTEAVVEAARKLPVDYRARDWVEEALRALDSPVGAGTDSGGSGAAPVSASADVATPEPAGTIPYVIGPPLRFDSRGAFDDDDSPVGVAATAEDGHEAPARNRQPVEPPSDPATGTTRREPPETDRQDGSTGAVAETEQVDEWTHRLRVPGGWLYRWETPAYNGSPGGAAMAFVPEPDEAAGK